MPLFLQIYQPRLKNDEFRIIRIGVGSSVYSPVLWAPVHFWNTTLYKKLLLQHYQDTEEWNRCRQGRGIGNKLHWKKALTIRPSALFSTRWALKYEAEGYLEAGQSLLFSTETVRIFLSLDLDSAVTRNARLFSSQMRPHLRLSWWLTSVEENLPNQRLQPIGKELPDAFEL